jgi:hypothetical protein
MFSRSPYNLFQLVLILALGLSACASLTEPAASPTPALPTQTPVPPTPTPPPLAAIVNGEWITEEEFQAEVDRYQAAVQAAETSLDDAARVVLDDLIAQVLLAQAARKDGFEITEADLESRLEALASEVGGMDALAAWQSEHNYTGDSFRSALKRAAEAAWMRDKIIAAVLQTWLCSMTRTRVAN